MSRRTHPPDALTVLAELNVQLSKGKIGIYDHGQAVKALLELQQAEMKKPPQEPPKTVITLDERGLRVESTYGKRISIMPWVAVWLNMVVLIVALVLK